MIPERKNNGNGKALALLEKKLDDRREAGNLRRLPSVLPGAVDFSSNDYLGFARNLPLRDKAEAEAQKQALPPNGATGSRLLSGNFSYAEKLEQELAVFFQTEAALFFNSGYAANLALLSAVPQRGAVVLYDELAHASLKDGYRLSFADHKPFKHNNLSDLESKLQKFAEAEAGVFVVVESVYSMDGDLADLPALAALCDRYGASLIVDEAHSTGIYSAQGQGLSVQEGIQNSCFARVHTFGKALGYHGACVAGSKTLIDYLINFARPFIYTTALPPRDLAFVKTAIGHLGSSEADVSRTSLFANIAFFKSEAARIGLAVGGTPSPIQTLGLPGNEYCKQTALRLQSKGFDVRPVLSPTVPKGQERLRICLHAYNTEEEIRGLLGCL